MFCMVKNPERVVVPLKTSFMYKFTTAGDELRVTLTIKLPFKGTPLILGAQVHGSLATQPSIVGIYAGPLGKNSIGISHVENLPVSLSVTSHTTSHPAVDLGVVILTILLSASRG